MGGLFVGQPSCGKSDASEIQRRHWLWPLRCRAVLISGSAAAVVARGGLAEAVPVVASNKPDAMAGAQGELMQLDLFGVCYAPAPLKNSSVKLLDDDFMAPDTKPFWGSVGAARGDLGLIRRMGANAVRLYGNNPSEDHRPFLAEAAEKQLAIIPGISDYPYLQRVGSCKETSYDCYEQVKLSYLGDLQNGFLRDDGTYDPVLEHVIVMNEPDDKIRKADGSRSVGEFCRAMVSAVDAMLDAEKQVNATAAPGVPLINFTVTVTYTYCGAECHLGHDWKVAPGVGQMLALQKAFLDPQAVNYTSRNNLTDFYWTRFINSFNTRNSAEEVRDQFMVKYGDYFPHTPFMVEEFHPIYIDASDMQVDLQKMWTASVSDILMLGYSFFEFQRRYDKEDVAATQINEERWGMYALGDYQITTAYINYKAYPVWCLVPITDADAHVSLPEAVARVFGGRSLFQTNADAERLCRPDSEKVLLDQEGFAQIQALRNNDEMEAFTRRVVSQLGGSVIWEYRLSDFAETYSAEYGRNFSQMVDDLLWKRDYAWKIEPNQRWVNWYERLDCVSDRSSDIGTVQAAIYEVCQQRTTKLPRPFNCSHGDIPKECLGDVWKKGDYVFSAYQDQASRKDLLRTCYWRRAAACVPPGAQGGQSDCIVSGNAATTVISQQSWETQRRIFQKTGDPDGGLLFMERLMTKMGLTCLDHDKLEDYAPWGLGLKNISELQIHLKAQPWVCGKGTGKTCDEHNSYWDAVDDFVRMYWPIIGLVLLCLFGALVAMLCTLQTPEGGDAQAWFNRMKPDGDGEPPRRSHSSWLNLCKDPEDDYITY